MNLQTTAHMHTYIKTYMNSEGPEPEKERKESLFGANVKGRNGANQK